MKLSAVIAHSTDPNEIITIVSTGAGSSPGYHTGRISARLCATAKCGKFTTDIREPSHFDLLLLNYGKYLSKSISFLSSVFANANRHMTEFRRLTGRQAEGIEGRFRTTSTWGTETLLSFFACDTAPRGCHYANNSQLV